MVYRNKDFNSPPKDLIDSKWKGLRDAVILEKNNHKSNSKCYRDTTLDSLDTLYSGKCAFCERDRGTELEVDHYRPKKERVIQNDPDNHTGYYWLTYEWSNLIPVCSICNRKKSTKFPILTVGTRIKSHIHIGSSGTPVNCYDQSILNTIELPLIINPETDTTPSSHFSYSPDGLIKPRTRNGASTIEICDLNRKNLVRDRIKLRHCITKEIESAIVDYIKHKSKLTLKGELRNIFKRLYGGCDPDSPYSLWNSYMYKRFDLFIVPFLSSNIQPAISRYFKELSN